MSRIWLSPPDLVGTELAALARAVDSGWVAPLGPEVDAFEEELAALTGRAHGVALSRAAEAYRSETFVQTRVGLHHLCFRAREREDVDEVYAFLIKTGAKIVHPPEEGPWAPGYYSVLFEDPDGIRLEVNHVPGKGLLAAKP